MSYNSAMSVLETEQFTIRPIEPNDAYKLQYAVIDNQKRLETEFPSATRLYMHNETAGRSAARAAASTSDSGSGYDAWIATDPDNIVAYGLTAKDRLSPRQQRILRVIQAWHGTPYGGVLGVHSLVDVSSVSGWVANSHPEGLPEQTLKHVFRNPSVALGASEVALSVTLIRPENTTAIDTATNAGMKRAFYWDSRIIPPISSLRQRFATLGDGLQQPRALWIHAATSGYSIEKARI